ncbi:hypothetical protein [Streptococcus dentiloxodontae]
MEKASFVEKHLSSFISAIMTVLLYLICGAIFRHQIAGILTVLRDSINTPGYFTWSSLLLVFVSLTMLLCLPGGFIYFILTIFVQPHLYSNGFYEIVDTKKVSATVLKKKADTYGDTVSTTDYWLVVKVDGKQQKLLCPFKDYGHYHIGDEILLTRQQVNHQDKFVQYVYKL